MSKYGELTPKNITLIAMEVQDGEADPGDARRLLELFCECVEGRKQIPIALTDHLHDAFRSYLNNKRTIESSLGLSKKKGRPPGADEHNQMQMAADILRLRLGGKSHQIALEGVAIKFNAGETTVADAWAKWQIEAIAILRNERPLDSYPWTPDEVKRLTKIFGKKDWFITPE